MNRLGPALLMFCWMLAYSIGPILHNPTVCAHETQAGWGIHACHATGASRGDLSLAATDLPAQETEEGEDCPFCRILSVPYQVAETSIQASRAAACEARLTFRRFPPVFDRYHGFTFIARAPPAV